MLFILSYISASNDFPVWPKVYNFKGFWSIPYWQSVREPIEAYVDLTDPDHPLQTVNYFSGVYSQVDDGQYHYEVQEAPNGTLCIIQDASEPFDFLPDLQGDGYQEIERTVINGRVVRAFRKYQVLRDDFYYTFYVDASTNDPVRFWQHGRSIMGSHPADYYLDFEEFGYTAPGSKFVPHQSCFIDGSYINMTTPSGPTYSSSSDKKSQEAKLSRLFNRYLRAHSTYSDDQGYCKIINSVSLDIDLPKTFSWKDRGIIGKPRDQSACGSCWAQSSGKAISAQLSLHYHKYIEASVQQIIDCTWDLDNYSNFACQGGDPELSYQLLDQRNISILSEDDNPYIGIGGSCPYNKTVGYMNDKGYAKVTGCNKFVASDPSNYNNTKKLLQSALYKYGPLSVLIRVVGTSNFGILDGSVYDDPQCMPSEGNETNHAVTLTGWTEDAWEIQNSWSDLWGDNGYGYISYNHDCGISQDAIIPILEFTD